MSMLAGIDITNAPRVWIPRPGQTAVRVIDPKWLHQQQERLALDKAKAEEEEQARLAPEDLAADAE